MKKKNQWYFPNNQGGQEEGFENQGINQFKMSPYGKLAREIIQNSYDAKIKDKDVKVKVEFRLVKMSKNKLPNMYEIQNSINASSAYFPESQRLERFKEVANEKLEEEEIDVLKISDYNTTGLVGIDRRKNSAWYGLIRSSGNSTKSGISGGSYGSGKHAAFVFSYFRTILYGTFVEDEGFAFQGKSILCSHKKEGIVKGNVGYWGEIVRNECKPIRDQRTLDDFYRRSETGTDVYVVGAKLEKEKWVNNILYSVIENFWKLIIDNKLEVVISNNEEEITIDSKNIRQLAEIGKNDNVKIDEEEPFNAYKFIELNDMIEEERYGSICEENDVTLKIAKLPQYQEKKILKMRDTEMKINIFSPRKRPTNFIGIMVATGEELNKKLRESEPQTHDSWNADNIEDEEYRKEVRDTIKKLDRWLNEQIDTLTYVDDIEEFDAEGLDFLQLDNDDTVNGLEELQKPFDVYVNNESEEQEILITSPSIRTKSVLSKLTNEENDIGEENNSNTAIVSGNGKKSNTSKDNSTGVGNNFHEVKMLFIKTPYDEDKNMYKIILRPEQNLDKCEIHFQRYTDSGELEKLKIEKAFINNTMLDTYSNVIKNIKLKENKEITFNVSFLTKRKCIMEVKVYVQN